MALLFVGLRPTTKFCYRYLGLYVTEVEAALAYDEEAVTSKGNQAITNFALSNYQHLMSAQTCCLGVPQTADRIASG